jgi:hypothetical protein
MTALRATAIALSFVAAAALAPGAEPPAARLTSAKPGGPPVVEITGLDEAARTALAGAKLSAEGWAKVARFVVDDGAPADVARKPPVAGAWAVAAGGLTFEPQFPLLPGVKYRAVFDPAAIPGAAVKGGGFSVSVLVPKPPQGPRVGVTAVYPSASRLPENTLRLYVHFSGPVERGAAAEHLKLVRADGTVVEKPFLELDRELWSEDGLRLTVLFDPGRVKRGLAPRAEHGPILEEGGRFTFAVDGNWPDLDGRPLLAAHKKTFDVLAPDDRAVWPQDWALVPPPARSDAPLLVRLAKPLDHALLGRMMWVADAAGGPVDGAFAVGGGERVVSFAPKKAWAKGDYKLRIDARLEDACGNRVGEPFELDVLKPLPPRAVAKMAERPFSVK